MQSCVPSTGGGAGGRDEADMACSQRMPSPGEETRASMKRRVSNRTGRRGGCQLSYCNRKCSRSPEGREVTGVQGRPVAWRDRRGTEGSAGHWRGRKGSQAGAGYMQRQ